MENYFDFSLVLLWSGETVQMPARTIDFEYALRWREQFENAISFSWKKRSVSKENQPEKVIDFKLQENATRIN